MSKAQVTITVEPYLIDALYKNPTGFEIPDLDETLYPNQGVTLKAGQQSVLARVSGCGKRFIKLDDKMAFYKVTGKNKEQVLLQNLLADPMIRLIIVTGSAGTGKAQPLNANILTPADGWVPMRKVRKGMTVSTPDGKSAKVVGVFPQGKRNVYRVHFTDGAWADCCQEHLWSVRLPGEDKDVVMPLGDFIGMSGVQIPRIGSYPGTAQPLPGDIDRLKTWIRLPALVMLNDAKTRQEVLDSFCIDKGTAKAISQEYLDLPIYEDLLQLMWSLGGYLNAEGLIAYGGYRTIDKVELLGQDRVQCIKIDHPSELYITDNYVVTHNTTMIGSYAMQSLDAGLYKKIVLSKPLEIVTQSKFWGTVPGDANDKMSPFLKSYAMLFENITGGAKDMIKAHMDRQRIEFFPLELMRGASFRESLIWMDEVQTLNAHELNTLGSRIDDSGATPSKLIVSGDLNQRDRKITREQTGMHILANSPYFLRSPYTAHVNLVKNERGVISTLFYDVFDRLQSTTPT